MRLPGAPTSENRTNRAGEHDGNRRCMSLMQSLRTAPPKAP